MTGTKKSPADDLQKLEDTYIAQLCKAYAEITVHGAWPAEIFGEAPSDYVENTAYYRRAVTELISRVVSEKDLEAACAELRGMDKRTWLIDRYAPHKIAYHAIIRARAYQEMEQLRKKKDAIWWAANGIFMAMLVLLIIVTIMSIVT